MISINLCDYQKIVQEVKIQKKVMLSIGMICLCLFFVGAEFLIENMRIWQVKDEAASLEQQKNIYQADFRRVQDLKKRQKRLGAIIQGIDGLRDHNIPFVNLLEDVAENLPQGMWLTSIKNKDEDQVRKSKAPLILLGVDSTKKDKSGKKQSGKKTIETENPEHQFVEIKGRSKNDRSIVQFMERLRSLDYLDHVILLESEQTWSDMTQIKKFTLYAHFLNAGQTV